MVQALHRALPERGIGVWSFDFPAHGDSPMGQEGLRVPFCMDDLETVEAWIRAKSPQVEVCYFASSFGAYITLLSLSRAPRNRPFWLPCGICRLWCIPFCTSQSL